MYVCTVKGGRRRGQGEGKRVEFISAQEYIKEATKQDDPHMLPDGTMPTRTFSRNGGGYGVMETSKLMSVNGSFFDLLFGQTPEMEELRQSLEDWAVPITRIGEENGKRVTRIETLRDFTRGDVRTSTFKLERYLYAILNPSLNIVQSFGSPNGTDCSMTSILVCAYVGDPRTGKLDAAHIKYVIPLNRPIRDSITPNIRTFYRPANEIDVREQKAETRYAVVTDGPLEEEMNWKWFNQKDYHFNGVIYPVAQNFKPEMELA